MWTGPSLTTTRPSASTPNTPSVLQPRASRGSDQGDLDGAIADYDEAIRLNPQYVGVHNSRGLDEGQDRGDLDGAIADYDEAIRLNPPYVDAYNNRGVARRTGVMWTGPSPTTTRPSASTPVPEAYYNRGDLRSDQGDLDGAIADYSEAIRHDPDTSRVILCRAGPRSANGDVDGAIADYDEAIRLDPLRRGRNFKPGVVRSDAGRDGRGHRRPRTRRSPRPR